MITLKVSSTTTPALGDVRTLGQGDVLLITPDMRDRPDWGRYVEAIAAAVSKGASVQWKETS